jgi:hypothetical protein
MMFVRQGRVEITPGTVRFHLDIGDSSGCPTKTQRITSRSKGRAGVRWNIAPPAPGLTHPDQHTRGNTT